MSAFLASILGNDHPLFNYNIDQLEKATGNDGVVTRLIADITESAHDAMRALQLDPSDTSAKELYQALNALVANGGAETILEKTQFVLLAFNSEIVSFNILDVIENAHHQLSFEARKLEHAQRYLRREIIKRYADHDRTDNTLVHQLADQMAVKRDKDITHTVADEVLNQVEQATSKAFTETVNGW